MADEQLARVAEVWNEAVEAGENPQAAGRAAFPDVTYRTVQRWVQEAGSAGLLMGWNPKSWRNGERLQSVADDLGVKRHDLARAVLRHVPNGKLHVHESDVAPLSVPTSFAASFGRTVRDARKVRGWTQEELAANLSEALGRHMKPLTVCRVEAGTRPTPLPEVAAFAAVLNLSLDALIRAQVQHDGEQS